jgi:putative hydrolase of the HAD superfamily
LRCTINVVKFGAARQDEKTNDRYQSHRLGFGARVERIFASGPMGVAKPDIRYFEAVSATLNVSPGEIFFIDDLAENIFAAKALGWQTLHFTEKTRDTLEVLLPL